MTNRMKWIAALVSMGLAGTSFAEGNAGRGGGTAIPGGQSGSKTYQSPSSQQGQSSQQSQQFSNLKNLLGQEVKDSQGQELGELNDVFINPRNGETIAAIGVENNRWALVPLQALNIAGSKDEPQVTVNTTKQHLQSGPTVQEDNWQALNSPGFSRSIYSHYRSAGMGMGGGGDIGGDLRSLEPQTGGSKKPGMEHQQQQDQQ